MFKFLKFIKLLLFIIVIILLFKTKQYFRIKKFFQSKKNLSKKKYLILTFSESEKKPQKGISVGIAGVRHVQSQFLNQLNKIGKLFNRTIVLPPPWLILLKRHNNNNNLNKDIKWNHYFNLNDEKNIDFNPPFKYLNNGSIENKNLSVKYYPYDYILDMNNMKKIDHNVDILVIVKYYKKKYEHIYEFLKLKDLFLSFVNFIFEKNIKFKLSYKFKNYGDNIIKKLKLKNYIFIHVRRGDFLNNKILAYPNGTKEYTTPEHIFKFLKYHKLNNDNIVIATNEKDKNYKNKLIKLMKNKNIYFESDFLKHLPVNIYKNDNFSIYLLCNYIAKKSSINIITMYLRLGNKIDYNLSEKIE